MDYFTLNQETGEYELVENIQSFDSETDYYVKEIVDPIAVEYKISDLTEDEQNILRKQILVNIIDNTFVSYLKDFLITVKEVYSKYDLYTIASAVNIEADKFDKSVVKLLYSKLLNVIAILAYAVSASEQN